MSPIASDQQRPDVGTLVSLYSLDAGAIGGRVYRFVPGPFNGAPVTYQTHTYTPVPIAIDGIAYGGEGAVARPTLSVAKVDRAIVAALLGADNLRGASVTRLRTLTPYLDGEPDADPTRHWPPDVYRIERLASQDQTQAVWQLASPLDFDKKQLPGRQVLRDVCHWAYRRWDGTQFVYDHAQCPYAGDLYFDTQGQPVTEPALDQPSRRLGTCCRPRYPDGVVPYGGFAGVARIRR